MTDPKRRQSGRQVGASGNGHEPEPLTPMSAEEWIVGEVYRLPSGKRARLRRPGLMAMLARGSIPNPLAGQVTRLLARATADEISARTQEQREEALANNSEAFVGIAQLTFVEPALVLDRPPDRSRNEIGPADLADRDLLWIFYDYVEGSADEVATFRLA